MMKQKTA